MTVEIESILQHEDIQGLLENAESTGSVKQPELAELIEAHQLDVLETETLFNELERRAIDVVVEEPEKEKEPPPPPLQTSYETTTDALQLFLREAGRHHLLTAPQEVELEELPQPGPPVPRPDPGRNARPHPRGREVRLAQWLQVLDLRDLVDPASGCACARRQGADDPHARPHRRRRRPASRGRGRGLAALAGADCCAAVAAGARAPGARAALRPRRLRAEDARGNRPASRSHPRASEADRARVAQAPVDAARDAVRHGITQTEPRAKPAPPLRSASQATP